MVDLATFLPPRSIEDILFERVRLVIGGEVYDLPALTIEANERWKSELELDLAEMLGSVEEAGADTMRIVQALTGEADRMIGLLRSYDTTNILPDDATLRSSLTPMALVRAVLEVWRAANPLVDIGLAGMAMEEIRPAASPPRSSSQRRNTAGRRAKSAAG